MSALEKMIEKSAAPVCLRGGVPVPAEAADAAGREKTLAYRILRAHEIKKGGAKMRIRFDAMISHDIT